MPHTECSARADLDTSAHWLGALFVSPLLLFRTEQLTHLGLRAARYSKDGFDHLDDNYADSMMRERSDGIAWHDLRAPNRRKCP